MAQLGCWEGYRLRDSWEEARNGQRWCVVRLEPKARRRRCCSGCGRGVSTVHDWVERRVLEGKFVHGDDRDAAQILPAPGQFWG